MIMANNQAFLVSYEGTTRNNNVCNPYKAVVHTADEAIAAINTWHTYGHREEYIHVNDYTAGKIRELFENDIKPEHQDQQWCYGRFRTTGCGCWDICFYPALADTLEEHERIYKEQREAAKQERMKAVEEARQRRLVELNEPKRGWYHASLEVRLYVYANRGNDWMEYADYSCTLIADSGMDAYNKVVEDAKTHPEKMMVRGNIAALQSYCGPTDGGFECTFLGVKTDDGYSTDLWEEWKAKGKI
jgi:hypothetical protein